MAAEKAAEIKEVATITLPVYVYEAQEARHERREKRLIIAVIIAVIIMFLSNVAWLVFVSQYEVAVSDAIVDTEGEGNANYIGQDGDIHNGKN
ncbi:MAG: hypothetical protein II453_12060 [Alphaproteobacteria bacterium]|nr:hypothetical protein [Alphaproteobacteria bacterium]